MEINADFGKRASAHTASMEWVPSPMAGVERKMLDRIGDEVARATSVVRYAPGSHFSAHTHTGGEEFLVLDGVFQDEHGDFPAGTYVRNPPTSSHTPGSEPGCTILVKLWQFDPGDRTFVRTDTGKLETLPDPARSGVRAAPLYRDGREAVRVEDWDAGVDIALGNAGGAEYFVLSGGFEEAGESFTDGSWLRLAPGSNSTARTGPDGARVWVKTAHLREVSAPSAT